MGGAFEQRADAAHDFPRVFPIADDPLGGFHRLGEVRRLGGKPAEAGVAVGDYSGERLVHFVRNGSRQFANGRDLRGYGKALLGISQSFLDAFAVLHVDTNSVPLDHTPFAIAQRLATHVEPAICAIRAAKPVSDLVRMPGLDVLPPQTYGGIDIVGMEKLQPSVFSKVFERLTGVFQNAPIDVVDLAVRRRAPHQGGNGFGDQAEMVFAGTEGLLSIDPVFNVSE